MTGFMSYKGMQNKTLPCKARCQILTNHNTFHKPMGSLGQTLSLCFITVINISFSFIPKSGEFTDRTVFWSSSTYQMTMRGGKKMTQETWMSSHGSSKSPWESQKSNSCLEPRYPWHSLDQRSIDRTGSEKGGTPRCLTHSIPLQMLQIFD